MPVTPLQTAFVVQGGGTVDLSRMFAVTGNGANPAYVVLSVLDRDEYTAGATDATGTLSGDGQGDTLAAEGGDARSAGIVFTYQPSTGTYGNSVYGSLTQMVYTASSSLDDMTSLSLYGFSDLAQADQDAPDPYVLMQTGTYIGSADVVTQTNAAGPSPTQATPGSIAATALTFVGDAWNQDGCWVLANTMATEAGAALPAQSALVGLPGVDNGEWKVAFDGPGGDSENWRSMVETGDIIVIGNDTGLAHITTCVSGSGAVAELVDNITYVNSSGQIQNSADDGSVSDVIVASPHPASQEFASALSEDVVIYRLDTPIVSQTESRTSMTDGQSLALSPVFSATDPFGEVVSDYQVYDTNTDDTLLVDGSSISSHTAATADAVTSLGSVDFLAGSVSATDTIEVRAFNGSYWGDWVSLDVTVDAPPILVGQTAPQTWKEGTTVSLTLADNTFLDPQNEKLTFSSVAPSWLTFNTETATFSGTVPSSAQNDTITVMATDTSGLTTSETFNVEVVAPPVISGASTSETASASLPVRPFADMSVADPNGGAQTETLTVTQTGSLPGILSDSVGGTMTDNLYTASGSAAQVSADIEGLTFTPATPPPGTSETATFTVNVADTAGESASPATTSVTDPRPALPPVIAGTAAGQQTVGPTAVEPFAGVTLTDPNGATLTVTVTPDTDNGTLSDTLGGSVSSGVYAVSGTAAQVGADIQGLTFTPETAATTGFTIAARDAIGQSATDDSTTVTATEDPPAISGARTSMTVSGATALFADATVSAPDFAQTETIDVTVTGGTLSTGGTSFAASGSSPSLTAALQGLLYTPSGQTSDASATLTVMDSGGSASTTQALSILQPATPTVGNTPPTVENACSPVTHITASAPAMTLTGGAGTFWLTASPQGGDWLSGGASGVATVDGSAASSGDILVGSLSGNDTILGGQGRDTIVTVAGRRLHRDRASGKRRLPGGGQRHP